MCNFYLWNRPFREVSLTHASLRLLLAGCAFFGVLPPHVLNAFTTQVFFSEIPFVRPPSLSSSLIFAASSFEREVPVFPVLHTGPSDQPRLSKFPVWGALEFLQRRRRQEKYFAHCEDVTHVYPLCLIRATLLPIFPFLCRHMSFCPSPYDSCFQWISHVVSVGARIVVHDDETFACKLPFLPCAEALARIYWPLLSLFA